MTSNGGFNIKEHKHLILKIMLNHAPAINRVQNIRTYNSLLRRANINSCKPDIRLVASSLIPWQWPQPISTLVRDRPEIYYNFIPATWWSVTRAAPSAVAAPCYCPFTDYHSKFYIAVTSLITYLLFTGCFKETDTELYAVLDLVLIFNYSWTDHFTLSV